MRKPEEEKKAVDPPIKGGAGSLPPIQEKEVRALPVKETREKIVGGPGTYPVREEKKVKIAEEP